MAKPGACNSTQTRAAVYRTVFEASPDAIFVHQIDGTVIDANPAACAIQGRSRDELIGLGVLDLVPGEITDLVRERFPKVAAGEIGRFETLHQTATGAVIPVEVQATRFDYEGSPALLAIVRDITERREHERALAEARDQLEQRVDERTRTLSEVQSRLQAMVDSIPGAVSWINRDMEYLGANRQVALRLGIDPATVPGRKVGFSGNNPAYKQAVERFMRSSLGEFESQVEVMLGGQRRVFLIKGQKYDQGDKAVLVGIDISDRERSRRVLETINTQLSIEVAERQEAEALAAERHEQLTHMTRLSTMGEMATALAHELNQPLTAITNYVNGCLRRINQGQIDESELAEAARAVEREARRAGEIVRRLRAFVRRRVEHAEPVDVNHAIREAIGLVGFYARQHRVRIDLELESALPEIVADRVQIEQVLVNLIRNAVDAMREAEAAPGRVRVVSGAVGDGGVRVSVIDNGTGVAVDELDQLFEHFYTTKAEGMGMGLAISRSIVELHGGTLRALRNPGRGMRFEMTLPPRPPESSDHPETEGADHEP